MKRTLQIFIIGFIFLSFSAKGQDDLIFSPPVLSDFQLSNKVKTVKEECHSAWLETDGSFSDLRDGWPKYYEANSTMLFDTSGRMLKHVFHSDNSSVAGTDTYEYEGDLLKIVKNRQLLLIREYDTSGVLIREQFKNKTPSQIADNKINWQKELQFSEDLYSYDENKRIIKIDGNDADPENNYTYTLAYNSSGNLNKLIFKLTNYESEEIEHFTHDSLGNLVKWELEYKGEGIEQTKIFEYSNNSLSTLTIDPPNHPDELKRIENYDHNLLVSRTTVFTSGETEKETYEYLFDERGNWITKIIKSNSDPDQVFVVSRTIEYY